MTPPDIVSWKNIRGYNMGYSIKYITPFRPVKILINRILINSYKISNRATKINRTILILFSLI